MNIGYAYLKQGDFDLAEKAYRETLAVNPNLAAAHYDLGLALKMQDKIEPAQKEFQEVYSGRSRASAVVLFTRDYLLAVGRFSESNRADAGCHCSFARIADAHYMLGIVLKQSGDLDSALAELKEAIRLDPNTPGPYNTIGQILRIKAISKAARKRSRQALV